MRVIQYEKMRDGHGPAGPPTRSGSAHQPGPRPIRGSLRGVAGLPGRKRRKHSQHLRPKILQPILCCCLHCLFQPKHFREAPPSCLCLNKSSEDIWSSSSNGRDSSVQSVYAVLFVRLEQGWALLRNCSRTKLPNRQGSPGATKASSVLDSSVALRWGSGMFGCNATHQNDISSQNVLDNCFHGF